ncbi:MAG: hypothetical protein KY391_04535 [Actinobacteria bacterium]|nr:hypothetical protein [Actinomycetota bacterium]
MEIRVVPGALEGSGSALVAAGSSLNDVAARVAATSGIGDAAADGNVAAAFNHMIIVWRRELSLLGEAVNTTGKATHAAADAYVTADDAAMPRQL